MADRLGVNHLVGQGRGHGQTGILTTFLPPRGNGHVLLILRLPLLIVGFVVGTYPFFRGVQFVLVQFLRGDIGNHAPIILQTDGILQNQVSYHLRVHEGESRRQHAPHGMPHHRHLLHPEGIQQVPGGARQQMKAVMNIRLGRFAETDLIRNNHPVTVFCQNADGILPVIAREVLAMEQQECLAGALSPGMNIHIGHSQLLSLQGHRKELQLRGIGVPFHADGERLQLGGDS